MATDAQSRVTASSKSSDRLLWMAVTTAAALALTRAALTRDTKTSLEEVVPQPAAIPNAPPAHQIKPDNIPPPRPDLPTYTLEQVAEHADEESMWFSFRGAVYDMTFFSQGHPGGAPVRK
jgi:cytochrome b involved in lipid metabolism